MWGRISTGVFAPALAIGTVAAIVQPAQAQSSDAVLKVNMVRGYATVYVNGQQVGRYGQQDAIKEAGKGIASVNINQFVKPGNNTLRIVWSESKFPLGSVHVSSAANGGNFRKLAEVELGVFAKKQGDRSVTFVVPKSSAVASASSDARQAPSVSGATPGKNPSSVNDKPSGKVGPGSRQRQTLMSANIQRGNITVFINGKQVGSYTNGLVPIDVSNYVKSGANQLRLKWDEADGSPMGSIRISYAVDKNQFRTVGEYDLNVFTQKKSGSNSAVTFNLP